MRRTCLAKYIFSTVMGLVTLASVTDVCARSLDYLNMVSVNSTLDIQIVASESVESYPSISNPGFKSLAVDRNNYPHVVYGGDHLYHTYYNGVAWTTETIDSSNGVGQYAAIAIDTSGAGDVIHILYNDAAETALKYATNADGSWTIDEEINTTCVSNGVIDCSQNPSYIQIALDGAGFVHGVYHNASSVVSHITNHSGSWIVDTVDSGRTNTGIHASLAIDTSDNLHVAYYDSRSAGNYGVSYATRLVTGTTWTVSELTNASENYPSLDTDTSGNVHLCYYLSSSSGNIRCVKKDAATTTWSSPIVVDSSGVGKYGSVFVDVTNNPHVTYYDETNGDLKYAKSSDAGVSWGSPVTVDSGANVGQNTTAVVDVTGVAHLSYYGVTNGEMKYATGTDVTWTVTSLAESGDVGQYSSLALDAAAKAHISYYENTDDDLKYVTNVSGSWVSEVIDSTGDVGKYSSIAIDSVGKIHIAYYDSTNTALKYATNTSGSWIVSTLAADDTVGEIPALVIDESDKIHIFFYHSYYTTGSYTDFEHITNASGVWVSEVVDADVDLINSLAFAEVGSTSAVVDAAGNLHVSYSSMSSTNGYYVLYASNETGAWVTEFPDLCGDTPSGFNSMLVGSDGYVRYFYGATVLSYSDNAQGFWDCSRLRNPSYVYAQYISATIDEDDNLYAAFYDTDEDKLRLVTSISTDADYGWNTAYIDSNNDTGKYASLKRDAAGYSHVSYYDVSNADLKYVKFTLDADADGVNSATDCDDADAAMYPGASEVCGDSLDNDCNGSVDDENAEPHVTWYLDTDGDAYGEVSMSRTACAQPSGFVSNDDDCDDESAANNPTATEVCGDLVDNDCDGNLNEGCVGETSYDDDGDTYTEEQGDCDDSNSSVSPGTSEICDEIDNDCDRDIDSMDSNLTGATTYYLDFDGDTYGDPQVIQMACSYPNMFVTNDDDCDDHNSSLSLNTTEVCDGLDNDCDGTVDNAADATVWYEDADGDSEGSIISTMVICERPAGYVSTSGDCDDHDIATSPNHTELCFDSIDNDCDGTIDESSCYPDASEGITGNGGFYVDTNAGSSACTLNPSQKSRTGISFMLAVVFSLLLAKRMVHNRISISVKIK